MTSIKITTKKHLQHISVLLFFVIAYPILFFYIIEIRQADHKQLMAAIVIFGSIALIHFGFTLMLHLNYFLVNKRDVFSYDFDKQTFSYSHGDKTISFLIDEINNINHYKSFAFHKKNIQLLSWDSYHHFVISLNNGDKVTLTSLLLGEKNKEILFPPDKVRNKLNLFRWAQQSKIK